MKRYFLVYLFTFCFFDAAEASKLDQLYSQLPWGTHSVGFRYVNARDNNRTYSRARNADGDLSTSQETRPIQIGIWYPSVEADDSKRMSFFDYVVLDEVQGRIGVPNESDYIAAEHRYLSADLWTGESDAEQLTKNLSLLLRANFNAQPVHGSRFPLVVFAGHEYFGLSSNAILHEFIASHGFVVVSFKNNAVFPGARNFKQHVNATADDVRFAKRFAEVFDNANPEKMVIAGNSLGALSIFDVALDIWSPHNGRGYPFRGIVSINGDIGSTYYPDYISTSFPRLKISTIADYHIPLLHFRCKGNYWCNKQFKISGTLFNKLDGLEADLISPSDLTGKEELSGMAFTSYYLLTDLSSYKGFRRQRPIDVARFNNQMSGFASMATIYLSHLNRWLNSASDKEN